MRVAPLLAALLLFAGALVRDLADGWIDRTVLPATLAETSAEVRDRNGQLLRVYPVENGRWRLDPGRGDVDPAFVDLLIRYEDKRFRRHNGIDLLALARAAVQALWNRRAVSGGSTLTMQVARLLENSGTGAWSGKLRQMRVALALERRLSKDEILRLYLTHAPYGGNLEGIRAASIGWFGREPARLTPAQAALLVALPQRPEARRPDRHPDAARAARNRVIARLAAAGILSAQAAGTAQSAALPTAMAPFPRLAAHETDHARSQEPDADRIRMTLDAGLQASLESLAADTAARIGQQVSVAILAADHETGEILASVGSPGYSDTGGRQGFVDMTRAVRSPGSTLKPLIYGLSFDQGLVHPETIIRDGPVQFDGYAPQNFDGMFRGDLRIREALQQSLNTPVVQLTAALGPARVMTALRRAGADPRLPGGKPGLAIALGGIGVTLRDLVQLYAGLAHGGAGPRLHARVEHRGQPTGRVMSDVAAWQVTDILRGIAPPPGMPASRLAYKTGTSYGYRDAWAVGYDGAHVVGVWVGRADGTPVPGAFGGDLAAPVLFEAFARLKPGFDSFPPPPPATLIVGTARLPRPLRRFTARGAASHSGQAGPDLVFPPTGARLASEDGSVTLKLRGGRKPFAILADGRPVLTGLRTREVDLPAPGPGYTTFVVIDAAGLSDRVTVRLE